MANNGEISNLWKPICTLFMFIYLYSLYTSSISGCKIYIIPIFYVVGMLSFYAWHNIVHNPKSGEMFKIHMNHHKKDFESDDFYGDKSKALIVYENNTPTFIELLDPSKSMSLHIEHDGYIYLMIILILIISKKVLKLDNYTLGFILLGYILMGIIGSAIHISYHIRHFYFENFSWYRELRTIHYMHHVHEKNFSMVNLFADKIGNTLVLEEEKKG